VVKVQSFFVTDEEWDRLRPVTEVEKLAMRKTTPTTGLEQELDAALHQVLDENDALKADLAALQAENRRLQDWIMGEEPDALTALQKVYSNPNTPVPNVIKSAIGALPFERSKPASVVALVDWREKTRTIRLRQMELDRARWAAEDAAKVIEHQPATTIPGEGEGDPAA
jgi:hypothetical protein